MTPFDCDPSAAASPPTQANAFEFAQELYEASRRWIDAECVNAEDLPDAVGVGSDELAQLVAAEVVPRATYAIYDSGIISPVASLGAAGRLLGTYYGIAIVGWLRRAAAYQRKLGTGGVAAALRDWLEQDFRAALLAQSEVAADFGWSRLYQNRELLPDAFASAATTLWDEWLGGGWAVCLNHFSGYDVVTKDIELERIPTLVERGGGPNLINAMLRFDSIVRPFAPFERPMSSRRRVIDLVAASGDIAWPALQIGS
jgi:hypothetical protein